MKRAALLMLPVLGFAPLANAVELDGEAVEGDPLTSAAPGTTTAAPDPFGFFLQEPVPLQVEQRLNHSGYVEWGLGLTSADNTHFGRDNGLDDNGASGIFNMQMMVWNPQPLQTDYWGFTAADIGLNSREANLFWGTLSDYRLDFFYDLQTRQNAKDAVTPYRGVGGNYLGLPSNWVAAGTTAGMTSLNPDLAGFDQSLQRETLGLAFRKTIDQRWSVLSSVDRQEKNGLTTSGAAFYLDASSPRAVVLPQPIDTTTDAFNLAARYGGENGNLELGYLYSRFDNHASALVWQNPYVTNAGAGFDYPDAEGSLGQAPDNQLQQIRLAGNYRIMPSLLGQVDAAFSQASQNQRFQPYTINPAAVIDAALPRASLDAVVNTTTLNASLLSTAFRQLTLQARYRFEDRDNRSPRDEYRYVRGDSGDQPDAKFGIYNRPVSTRKNTLGLEGSYRLPSSARLSLGYQYQEISRYNTAVNKTREDQFDATLKLQPLENLSARLYLAYADRAASTYQWDQSYYALLDAELINETPATQRYNNHPLLSQYFLANRQRLLGKATFNLVQSVQWQHNLDLLWSQDDYDKTTLGLTEENRINATFSSSYLPSDMLTLTAWYSLDQYAASQRGRAFRGGIEKNPFVTIAPFPQASDPGRDWKADPTDTVHAIGMHGNWIARRDQLDFDLDYSFSNTSGEQQFTTYGAPDLDGIALPDNRSRQHHLNANANWHVRRDVTLKFNYQYYRYQETTWAQHDVAVDSMDNVLWTATADANEVVNFVGVSMLYYLP